MPDVRQSAQYPRGLTHADAEMRQRDILPVRGSIQVVTRWRRYGAAATTLLLVTALAMLLAACGSSGASSRSPSASSNATIKQTCRQIEGVLANGPDPEADPVGHAQAQVLPLRQIHTSDQKLRKAIDGLAAAYQAFSASNGSSSAKSAVNAASEAIEVTCPKVAS